MYQVLPIFNLFYPGYNGYPYNDGDDHYGNRIFNYAYYPYSNGQNNPYYMVEPSLDAINIY